MVYYTLYLELRWKVRIYAGEKRLFREEPGT